MKIKYTRAKTKGKEMKRGGNEKQTKRRGKGRKNFRENANSNKNIYYYVGLDCEDKRRRGGWGGGEIKRKK